jgi:S1-C subfamily serine protease
VGTASRLASTGAAHELATSELVWSIERLAGSLGPGWQVDPAVVDINTVLRTPNNQAAGTGIVLDSSGVVLTNNHVISGATSITVTDIGDNQTYPQCR